MPRTGDDWKGLLAEVKIHKVALVDTIESLRFEIGGFMRRFFIATSPEATSLAMAGTIGASGAAAFPLKVELVTFDGKKKVKVARKLKAVASCSKDCSLRITFALRTPAGTIKGTVPGNRLIPVNARLNNTALKYLKTNYRASRYTINVAAVDLETGKRSIKRRTFRFYK